MNDDIHALSGAYAVDALDPEERVHFERHLHGCVACQEEVASLRATAAELAGLAETAPPPALRDAIMRQIPTIRPLPPARAETANQPTGSPPADRAATASTRARPTQPRRRSRLLAAVAAALLVIGGLAVWRAVDTTRPPTVAQQVLDAPDAARVAHILPDGATATIVRSKDVGRAVLVTSQLPPAPPGKVYQLWLQDPAGSLHPAGLLTGSGDQVFVLTADASDAAGAGITVEPAGGSPQPTSQPLALFTFT
ncbi:MAG: anti-sigma factor [Intrasporangium sp.]|uniref:anti-sigma factor n=1 Tax=Intrasporangium sp. TaxID=1925024 RepID=UPI002647CC80|nr:anti-sigma factor [Intrasporangium sp.]MDN5796179.1 anti-sigma factor [Intrasporangium sp.]